MLSFVYSYGFSTSKAPWYGSLEYNVGNVPVIAFVMLLFCEPAYHSRRIREMFSRQNSSGIHIAKLCVAIYTMTTICDTHKQNGLNSLYNTLYFKSANWCNKPDFYGHKGWRIIRNKIFDWLLTSYHKLTIVQQDVSWVGIQPHIGWIASSLHSYVT